VFGPEKPLETFDFTDLVGGGRTEPPREGDWTPLPDIP